jgi:hypothetical protein
MAVFELRAQCKYKAAKQLRLEFADLKKRKVRAPATVWQIGITGNAGDSPLAAAARQPNLTLEEALLDQKQKRLQILNRLAQAETDGMATDGCRVGGG